VKVTLVQELRKAEAKITQNIGTAQHLLNCTITGLEAGQLDTAKAIELLKEVQAALDNVSD
jgi:hypothetical protein